MGLEHGVQTAHSRALQTMADTESSITIRIHESFYMGSDPLPF